MEMTVVLLTYIFTFLIPINGIILLGMINERKKMRRILIGLWKVVRK
jgi:hypothetical protein